MLYRNCVLETLFQFCISVWISTVVELEFELRGSKTCIKYMHFMCIYLMYLKRKKKIETTNMLSSQGDFVPLMIRKTSIKYIYIYFIFHNFISNQKESIKKKKKKKPTTILTLKTENKNDSIKNQNNFFFFGWARGAAPPTPPAPPLVVDQK